jgi:hypothetical protein
VTKTGIGLTIGFIAPYNQLQLSLSGLPRPYNSRLNISRQLCSHCIPRNRSSGILCQHYPGCCRNPGSLPSSFLPTNSLTNSAAENSEVYDLWTDCREDSALGIVDCLAITRKRVPSGLGLARYQATSTPRRARHNIISRSVFVLQTQCVFFATGTELSNIITVNIKQTYTCNVVYIQT